MSSKWKKLIDLSKLVLIFITLTFFFYGLIIWVADKVDHFQRGEHPKGRAVKVVQWVEQDARLSFEVFLDRLLLYYWFGE